MANSEFTMILRQIKAYIKQHEKVSDLDIHHHFDVSLDAIHAMLKRLIQQGQVHELSSQSCSTGTCGGCQQGDQIYYQWLNKKLTPLSIAIEVS